MNSAWLTQLTPLTFLRRSLEVFPDKTAITYQGVQLTYREFGEQATRQARALRASGVQPGDRVACLLPNVPEMLVAHFGVPLAGAVLVPINTRLSAEEIRYICDHSGAKVLLADAELYQAIQPVAAELTTVDEIVLVPDRTRKQPQEVPEGLAYYEDFLRRGSTEPLPWEVADENSPLSINYTSGTTGKPKGVLYTHRGAYLNALGEIIHSGHGPTSVYLWTLPMFHCNGWCTAWAVVGIGGTQVCLREVRGSEVWQLIDREAVTHLNGAPAVLTTIAEAAEAHPLRHQVVVTTAGAPPSPTVIEKSERLGFHIVHVYGLTETYGPYSVCEQQAQWSELEQSERARLQARQGVGMIQADSLRVVDENMIDVPADGSTMGEIVMRGNNVTAGYFNDSEGTELAFRGGWFHSGDLGVRHPDGYVELRDRAKDVVISGGENISTVEVEQAIVSHLAVLEATVVGVPDDKWGERPKAFVVPHPDKPVSEQELIEHVRSRIARYKAPSAVQFMAELPKTSTGKIQKFLLREQEWTGLSQRIHG